jgi:gliding motility-associated-like protein
MLHFLYYNHHFKLSKMNYYCLEKKHWLVLLLLVLFTSTLSFAQLENPKWRFSNPKVFGFNVLDAEFVDNNTVIAVGSSGAIARSTDGGTSWTYGAFTFTDATGLLNRPTFNDVHVVNANLMYAVGSQGAMAKSTNGGITWSLVVTPLYPGRKNINGLWFINKDTGYIGGEATYGTGTGSQGGGIPKLFFTRNGGATWDSLPAPIGGQTRYGYIANSSFPPLFTNITADQKEIHRIVFTNDSTGFISGSGLVFQSHPAAPSGTTSSGAMGAALLWKFNKGTLTDYSLGKERLGYSGVNTNPVIATTRYGSPTPSTQTYRALQVINDSMVLVASFNNATVVRVRMGKNDSTANLAVPGSFDRGKYEVLNFPFPPLGAPAIPLVQVLPNSNMWHMRRASNGNIYLTSNFGNLAISSDTGRSWRLQTAIPTGRNYSNSLHTALAFAPNGKLLGFAGLGVVSDSVPGSVWKSNYVTVPGAASYSEIEFADCNNGIGVGGAQITVTTDGGKTWTNRFRPDFQTLNISLNAMSYVNPNLLYAVSSIGTVYRSLDKGVTMDPIFADPRNGNINDMTTIGTDSIWACSFNFNIPTASRTPFIFRSFNRGASWDTIKVFPVGTAAPRLTEIKFSSPTVGYTAGSLGKVYKTTDRGTTWTDISPFPALTPVITYNDIFALNDNTVFVVGNGFPRKVVYRTTDGGATWTDITNNLATLGTGNFNAILMHDANNGYLMTPGIVAVTNNGGATWRLDVPPINTIFNTASFAPRVVPAGTPFENRRLFVTGFHIQGDAIMEYGDTTKTLVSTAETITATCTNTAQGSIVVTASGGIAPYTYSINGGPFQTSNTFTGLTTGPKTITIQDFACGTVTKTVTVGPKAPPFVTAGPDKTIVDGDQVTLDGAGVATPASIAWTPAATLTGANTYVPFAKPSVTTNYTITVTDANGCVSTDNALITVVPYCLKVLNAFTPNGDGINERWLTTTSAACTNQISASVFNRYGHVVFKNDNYQNNWDGTYKGEPLPDGTYYYVITYRLINGNKVIMKGDVTILR